MTDNIQNMFELQLHPYVLNTNLVLIYIYYYMFLVKFSFTNLLPKVLRNVQFTPPTHVTFSKTPPTGSHPLALRDYAMTPYIFSQYKYGNILTSLLQVLMMLKPSRSQSILKRL